MEGRGKARYTQVWITNKAKLHTDQLKILIKILI